MLDQIEIDAVEKAEKMMRHRLRQPERRRTAAKSWKAPFEAQAVAAFLSEPSALIAELLAPHGKFDVPRPANPRELLQAFDRILGRVRTYRPGLEEDLAGC